ncbi:fructosamine kinase family protein [Acidithiobacillus sp. IBUN Pt1247-S3]|uniref:fructosamine kinase family protein n=1 Tax=Acidithiobacillus sp. IBUN Pt1247-S3 TaxID=3166642 RepID=UPI0034E44BD5
MDLERLLNQKLGGDWQVEASGASDFFRIFRAHSADQSLFLKVGKAREQAEAEADSLRALQAAGAPVPQVFGLWDAAWESVLALQLLAFQHKGVDAWSELARVLANLHRAAWPQFGWARNNFLGATLQHNQQTSGSTAADWLAFLHEQRLAILLAQIDLRREEKLLLQNLLGALPEILRDHAPQGSLTHGDLWSGNWGAAVDGGVWLFDPAVAVSDREMDLAMLELFAQPPMQFWQRYQELATPDFDAAGYAARRPLYQLYHLLNHWLLFGRSYTGRALAAAQAALSAAAR